MMLRVKSLVERFTPERGSVLLAGLAYCILIYAANVLYLSRMWPEYGFLANSTPSSLFWAVFCISIILYLFPTKMTRASDIFSIFVLLFIYIPTVIITVSVDDGAIASVSSLTVAFAVALSLPKLLRLPVPQHKDRPGSDGLFFLIFFLTASAVILTYYYDRIRFVGIDETYAHRANSQSDSLFIAYTTTYYLYVACPAVLVFGLLKGKRGWPLVLSAIGGFALFYGVGAHKIAVLLPFVIIASHIIFNVMRVHNNTLLALVCISALLSVALADFLLLSGGNSLIASLVLHRGIGIPGLTYHMYADVFEGSAQTLWSHVRGASLIVEVPLIFAENGLWPRLGNIVGDAFYGQPEHNVNANFLVSDGLAAAGHLGVIFIGLIFAMYITALDYLTKDLDQKFVILVIIPLALVLTNSPFFTFFLSFGGGFWLVYFCVCSYRCGALKELSWR